MSGDLRLTPALERVIQRWYIVAAAGVIGGIAGLLFSLSRPPVYDAFAVLTVGFNFDLTQPLTQYDSDLALHRVASVVVEGSLWERVLKDAGIQAELKSGSPGAGEPYMSHWLARKGTRWEFTVSSRNPELSARAANAWASIGEATLTETLIHAFEAKSTQLQLNEVLTELGRAQADSSSPIDQIEHLEKVANELQARLQVELEAAQGVASFVSFNLTEEALPLGKPATRGRGQIVLAGTSIGILFGIVATIVVGPTRTRERSV